MEYGYKKSGAWVFADVIAAAREALAEEGLGVLTEIDVQATMKKKLNIEREPYCILGACHPQSAAKALDVEPGIGLLLPCNVVVYQEDDTVTVTAIRPTVAMGMVDNPALEAIATDIEQKLMRGVDRAAQRLG